MIIRWHILVLMFAVAAVLWQIGREAQLRLEGPRWLRRLQGAGVLAFAVLLASVLPWWMIAPEQPVPEWGFILPWHQHGHTYYITRAWAALILCALAACVVLGLLNAILTGARRLFRWRERP